MDELTNKWLQKFGIKTKPIREDASDPLSLERYRKIPLHAIFLYTSEDEIIEKYIIDNWGALDSLSGSYCDIHPTLDQFESKEDAYDFIEGLKVIQDSKSNIISHLPGIFFWDMNAKSGFVSFSNIESEKELTKILRDLFDQLRAKPEISTIQKFKSKKTGIKTKKFDPNKKEFPWWAIALICGFSSVLIYKALENNPQWIDEGLLGISITIFVLMLNPKRRFYKAFWTSMTLLTSITLFPAFDFLAIIENEELGKIEKAIYNIVLHDQHWIIFIVLGVVAIASLILDYLERIKE